MSKKISWIHIIGFAIGIKMIFTVALAPIGIGIVMYTAYKIGWLGRV